MKVSAHISYKEATASGYATRHGLDNSPNEQELANIKLWAEKVFEPTREQVSKIRGKDSPIHINSIFRSERVNEKIGGSETSQHCAGRKTKLEEAAGDIETNYDDFNNKDLFMLIKEKGTFDQLIWEFGDDEAPAWVHVSYRKGANRKEVIKAIKVPDPKPDDPDRMKTKYIPF